MKQFSLFIHLMLSVLLFSSCGGKSKTASVIEAEKAIPLRYAENLSLSATEDYTIGQRKGLNLSMGRPVFVVEIRPETNEVVIGESEDVFTNVLCCSKLNWIAIEGLEGKSVEVMAKIRYSHRGAPCTIRQVGEDLVECTFHEPVRAATPGQAVVFYDGPYVVGGGTII